MGRGKRHVHNISKNEIYFVEFNKENSLDPVCTNELYMFENMFIRGTMLSKAMNLKEPM